MNTPRLETRRLILRRFTERDIAALYQLLSDKEINTFLPWFPLQDMDEATAFFESRCAAVYRAPRGCHYAICLKSGGGPIGYIHVSMDGSHDLGYGLQRRFWRKGIVTEAGQAVIERLRRDGLPYITATHDVNNPRSGSVMRRLGMKYQYSYEERWQPKDFFVTFRMYQLNLDGAADRVYKEYWEHSTVHFVETEIT